MPSIDNKKYLRMHEIFGIPLFGSSYSRLLKMIENDELIN